MKWQTDLLKKKNIKTRNNKKWQKYISINIESKKQTKQARRTETESWMWRGF